MIRNKSRCVTNILILIQIVILSLIIAFSIIETKSNDLACTENMRNYYITAFWLIVSATIIELVVCIFSTMMVSCSGASNNAYSIMKYFIIISRLAEIALLFTDFIISCLFYGSSKTCPDLQFLLLVLIITIPILFGLFLYMIFFTYHIFKKMLKLRRTEKDLQTEIQNMSRNLEATHNEQRSPDLEQTPVEFIVVSSPRENNNLFEKNENFDSIERLIVKNEMLIDSDINIQPNNYNNKDHNKNEIINNEL